MTLDDTLVSFLTTLSLLADAAVNDYSDPAQLKYCHRKNAWVVWVAPQSGPSCDPTFVRVT